MSVDVEDLTKHFTAGQSPAVSGVSLRAPTGAITALLGPSGAGKSTVLRLIAGLELPDSGTVRIEGEDCSSVPVQERGVGFVFQNYALFKNMTVRENVAFGLRVRKVPRRDADARADELLKLVQLEHLGARYPSQLSGGQRQRVAFARALAIRPKVLLLDEPFGALDVQVRVELRSFLHDLHDKTRVTTILVTHDQAEALEVAQHVVVMADGRVAQAGPPQEVYDHPATPFVASFFGGASMLRGSVGAFIRPHDIRLSSEPSSADGEPGRSVGRVDRVRRIGGTVKVSLSLPSGETVNVEMSAREFDALGLETGGRAFVDVGSAKRFVGDYAI